MESPTTNNKKYNINMDGISKGVFEMNDKEPLILVFEGASLKTLEAISVEISELFKGTRFENHTFITNNRVRGMENPYGDKLDKIIKLLKEINDRQERRQFD